MVRTSRHMGLGVDRLQSPGLIVAHDDTNDVFGRCFRAHADDLLGGSTAHWLSITIGWVVVAAWSHVYHSS